MASESQQNYVRSLAEKKVITLTPEIEAYVTAVLNTPGYLENCTNQQIDEALTLLKQLPWKPREVVVTPDDPNVRVAEVAAQASLQDKVKPARYFIVDPFDDKEKFVKVDKPEPPSRWAGYTFVSVQASDDFYPVKDKEHKEQIFHAILNAPGGPIQAMNEYGMRLGVCGNCGRTLTDRDSRLRGIGPICAQHIMMENAGPDEDQLAILRQLGLVKD